VIPSLGIGFIGSGFITQFHIKSFAAIRNAHIVGVWSPNGEHADSAVQLARREGVGDTRVFPSIRAMVGDPEIQAIWVCGPNFSRVSNIAEIVAAVRDGAGTLAAIACEKPLARNVSEARQILKLVRSVKLRTGYLENQVFMPAVVRAKEVIWRRGASLAGRPYLARATEEHGGPHSPWFWKGDAQGGGALNDMMCHSIEATRFLLTDPQKKRSSLRARAITARTATLKWKPSRNNFIAQLGNTGEGPKGPQIEDYASATVEFQDEDENSLFAELMTSWSFVGPGLRITMELLGPEYSMSFNSLDSGAKVFFSRMLQGAHGEDLLEKQNAESGLMPVLANESADYGYEAENRHMVKAFLSGKEPLLTFNDGVEVVELLMAAYMSAEQRRTVEFRPEGLDTFVPMVAKP
jgi:predicted dehydrogenase